MIRHFKAKVNSADIPLWRLRVLEWSKGYDSVALLENRGEPYAPSWISNGWMAGVGIKQRFNDEGDFFHQLHHASFHLPLFGYLGYDLKNQVENLQSINPDRIKASDGCFFEPLHFIRLEGNDLELLSHEDPEAVYQALLTISISELGELPSIALQSNISEAEYKDKVATVREYIRQGEVYELNLCVEFFAEEVKLPVTAAYLQLMESSKTPFSAYLKLNDIHVLCASPERFLRKKGRKVISQPIKGTRKRGRTTEEDERLQNELLQSEKDRAENVMIVDLVRNDLARSCEYGSIAVEELFGIYSFSNVHQMISTIIGTAKEGTHFSEIIRQAFPMGSMTGAPKVRAMELIEELEISTRGIYSGSIGIIYPDGDFDLNVVIRTILYNEKDSCLSVHAGGAITWDSDANEEWEEIKTKLSNITQLFRADFIHNKNEK